MSLSMDLTADWSSHHIEGIARAAEEAGKDGRFRCPLISHIEGNLWMGGCIDGIRLPDEFANVLSLYPWEQYEIGPDTIRYELRLYDAAEMPAQDEVNEAVKLGLSMVRDGQTLIHCQAGLNRSGLVSALILRDLGHTSEGAIALLRSKRHPVVLCNETFETYLLGLDR
jgi:hypothetical protein